MRNYPNWLDAYLDYTAEQESPEAFHRWVALSTVAAALERRVWVDRGDAYLLYPNLYVVLIADSAICRKTVALRIGASFLRALENPPVFIRPKGTSPAIIKRLSELTQKTGKAQAFICSPELITLLKDSAKTGLMGDLTDLYDCPARGWGYDTISRGAEDLKDVCINWVGATTMLSLRDSIPRDAVGAGLTSRTIYINKDTPRGPFEPPKLKREMRPKLLADLNEIRQLAGEFQWEEEGYRWFKEWYGEHFNRVREEKLTAGYFGRKHDMAIKLAMISSAMESGELVLKERHVKRAVELLDSEERDMISALEIIGATAMGQDTNRVLQIIKRSKEISHSKLLARCWRFLDKDQMRVIVDTLEKAGLIEGKVVGKGVVYRAK